MKKPGSIQIRIRPGGKVYLDGMNEALLDLAAVLSPDDARIQRRMELLRGSRTGRQPREAHEEQRDGHAEPGK